LGAEKGTAEFLSLIVGDKRGKKTFAQKTKTPFPGISNTGEKSSRKKGGKAQGDYARTRKGGCSRERNFPPCFELTKVLKKKAPPKPSLGGEKKSDCSLTRGEG